MIFCSFEMQHTGTSSVHEQLAQIGIAHQTPGEFGRAHEHRLSTVVISGVECSQKTEQVSTQRLGDVALANFCLKVFGDGAAGLPALAVWTPVEVRLHVSAHGLTFEDGVVRGKRARIDV